MSSLQDDRPAPFHSELRDARVLLLDSGEALDRRILIQDELLTVLEQLEQRACPVVLGARSEIFDENCLQPRLRDRLREGRLLRLRPGGGSALVDITARRRGEEDLARIAHGFR